MAVLSVCVSKNFWLYLSPLHGIVSPSFDESPVHLCSVTGNSRPCLFNTQHSLSCHAFATHA